MKSVVTKIRIWMKRPGHIAIACNKSGFISSVSSDPKSKRFHPNLYSKLERLLHDHGEK